MAQDFSGQNSGNEKFVFDRQGNQSYVVRLRADARLGYGSRFAVDEIFEDYQQGDAVNLVQDVAWKYGIQVEAMTSWVGATFTAFLNAEQLRLLKQDWRVESINANHVLELSADTQMLWTDSAVTLAAPPNALWSALVTQTTEMQGWGKRAVNLSTVSSNGSTLVYLIDVGAGQHSDLNVVEWVNASNPTSYKCGTRAGITCNSTVLPHVIGCSTHATATAGIIGAKTNGSGIIGIDPGVAIVSVSVLTSIDSTRGCTDGDLTSGSIAAALNWVMSDISAHASMSTKLAVVNMSINGTDFAANIIPAMTAVATPAGTYPGAFVAESAGNQFEDACGYAFGPLSVSDGIMVVGAINNHGQPVVPLNGAMGFWKDVGTSSGGFVHEPGSNFGSCVDTWAPGDAIFTTMGPPSEQRSDTVYSTYGYGSGTSFAAPHVAGLAAFALETVAYASPSAVEQFLRQSSLSLGSRAPTTSVTPDFHNNSAGAPISMPTLSRSVSRTRLATPYAEFVVSSSCFTPLFLPFDSSCHSTTPWLNYTQNPPGNMYPFTSGTYNTATLALGWMANGGTVMTHGGIPKFYSFDSYGSLPYTCEISTRAANGTETLLATGAHYYYVPSVATTDPTIVADGCTSAVINNVWSPQ